MNSGLLLQVRSLAGLQSPMSSGSPHSCDSNPIGQHSTSSPDHHSDRHRHLNETNNNNTNINSNNNNNNNNNGSSIEHNRSISPNVKF